MIFIVDGGSTKCDWVLVDLYGNIHAQTHTQGMNPNGMDTQNIPTELSKNTLLNEQKNNVTHLFFYGSGCGFVENQEKIQKALQIFFPKANILVKDDLTAAAYSAYQGSPCIVGILGTGSNSCFFNGEKIEKTLPSLGYLLGDEGSGYSLGKALVKHYFMKKLPPDLHQEFEENFSIKIEDFIKNIYHKPKPNAYLATFNPFLLERKEHFYIKNLLISEFRKYFENQILPYKKENTEVNFVGSIAHLYEDVLREITQEFSLKIGTIVQKPIENLVKYHKNYILSTLE